jgi:TPR repeat protein
MAAESPKGSSQMIPQSPIVRLSLASAVAVGFVTVFNITAGGPIDALVNQSHAAESNDAGDSPAAGVGKAAMIEMPGLPSIRFEDGGALAAPADLGPAFPVSGSPRPVRAPGSASLSNIDASVLLTRGDSLFGFRDFASARLFYERAANAGNGQAAIRLGQTYDPSFLEWARLRWVRGDAAAAAFWYRRARELGMSDAETLLKGMKGE